MSFRFPMYTHAQHVCRIFRGVAATTLNHPALKTWCNTRGLKGESHGGRGTVGLYGIEWVYMGKIHFFMGHVNT